MTPYGVKYLKKLPNNYYLRQENKMMKWGTRHGRMQITVKGTPRAHWYYWIRQEGARDWRAGYYGFGQEIAYRDKSFPTSAQARKYCEAKDAEAVIIVAVTA
jgi:hypothetical protein